MSDLRYSAEKTFKVSIDFTQEELEHLHAIVVRSKLYRYDGSKDTVFTPLELRLVDIVNEVLK